MPSCDDALNVPPPPAPTVPLLLVAAVALVDVQGRVLLADRPPGKAFAGCWEFPGGKLEPGETPEYALMRELREELGIETRPTCYYPVGFASYTYEKAHLFMPLYACRKWRGEPTGREGQNLKWVHPRQMYNYQMPPADIPLIAQLIDRL